MNETTMAPAESTLYVGNLNYKRDEEGLKKLFSKYGKVIHIKMIMETGQNRSKGIAFIKMKKADNAQMAIKGLNGRVIDGRTLKVSVANSRFSEEAPVEKEEEIDSTPQKKRRSKKSKKGLQELFDFLGSR
jgi:RNA recognition motif-containing protein